MLKKSLKKTNPYLKDNKLGKELLYQFVSSSTAVEGVLTKYPKLSKSMEKRLKEVIAVHEAIFTLSAYFLLNSRTYKY